MIQQLNVEMGEYLNEAIMEEEANGGWTRYRRFSELQGGYGCNKLVDQRAGFGVVIDRELSWRPASGVGRGLGE